MFSASTGWWSWRIQLLHYCRLLLSNEHTHYSVAQHCCCTVFSGWVSCYIQQNSQRPFTNTRNQLLYYTVYLLCMYIYIVFRQGRLERPLSWELIPHQLAETETPSWQCSTSKGLVLLSLLRLLHRLPPCFPSTFALLCSGFLSTSPGCHAPYSWTPPPQKGANMRELTHGMLINVLTLFILQGMFHENKTEHAFLCKLLE